MFRVAVVRGRGLRGGDRRSLFRSGRVVEPVVKARIKAGNGVLMDEAETRAKNQSSNPVWNSVFDFELEHTEICDDGSAPELELLVEDAAMYSKNRFVGQAVIPLAPFRNKVRERVWVPLQSRDDQCKGAQRGDNRGELLIFACWVFDPAVSIHKRFSAQDARHSMHAVNDLQIVLIRARGLPVSTKNSKSNVVAALRVGAESWRSLTKQRTQHPKWYETCSLAVHRCDEQKAKLEVTIYDSDQNARNIFIGRVSLPLAPLLNQSNEYFRAWRPLESEDLSYRGEVELAMRWIFNPSKAFFEDIPNGGKQAPNMLHVAIVQARELPLSDAYVSLELNDRRMACTSFQPHTTMPAWREFFAFPVTRAMAEEREEEDTHRLLLSFKLLDSKRHNSILGVCHVDILGELSNRELVRSWRKLSSLKGEIEIELFWTFDKEAEPLEPEPLHRLHFRDISAHILRSSSDSVLEGAASVGVLAKLVEPRSNDNAGAGDFFATCRLRILKLSGLRESSVGPRVLVKVTQNGREIHRAELNRLPSSCQKSDHISLSIFKGENAEHVDNIVVELWKDSVDVGGKSLRNAATLIYLRSLNGNVHHTNIRFSRRGAGRDRTCLPTLGYEMCKFEHCRNHGIAGGELGLRFLQGDDRGRREQAFGDATLPLRRLPR